MGTYWVYYIVIRNMGEKDDSKQSYICTLEAAHYGLAYLSKCLAMVDLSTVTREDGSTTGSDISVLMMGSRNSSQASA